MSTDYFSYSEMEDDEMLEEEGASRDTADVVPERPVEDNNFASPKKRKRGKKQ